MKTSFTLLFFLCVIAGSAQINHDPIIHISFDEPQGPEFQETIDAALTTARSRQEAFTTARCKGIKGLALDLTDNVPIRVPKILDENDLLDFVEHESFSIQLWLKTKKNAPKGNAIMSNKKWKDTKSSGWKVGTKENGAWY